MPVQIFMENNTESLTEQANAFLELHNAEAVNTSICIESGASFRYLYLSLVYKTKEND